MSTEAYGLLAIVNLAIILYFVVMAIWSEIRLRRGRRLRLEAAAQLEKWEAEKQTSDEMLKRQGTTKRGDMGIKKKLKRIMANDVEEGFDSVLRINTEKQLEKLRALLKKWGPPLYTVAPDGNPATPDHTRPLRVPGLLISCGYTYIDKLGEPEHMVREFTYVEWDFFKKQEGNARGRPFKKRGRG